MTVVSCLPNEGVAAPGYGAAAKTVAGGRVIGSRHDGVWHQAPDHRCVGYRQWCLSAGGHLVALVAYISATLDARRIGGHCE